MTYRAGIIGAGGIAGMGILGMHDAEDIGERKFTASHAGGYNETGGIELVAVADVDEEKLDRFGDAWDLPPEARYTDHREMLRAEDLDVVSVATPSYLHRDHVVDVAGVGDPALIWCEKPIASGVTEGREMIEACEEANAELLVNHSFRFTEKFVRLRELLREGLVGEVHSVGVQYRMELMRNSTHVFDTLGFLLEEPVTQVSGYLTGENEAVDALEADHEVDDVGGGGHLVLDDGTFVTVDCTVPRTPSRMNYRIVGSEGLLSLTMDDEWRYWALEDGTHVEREIPGIEGAWTWDEDYRAAFPSAVAHLVDVLEGRAENRSPGREALRSLEVITGIYASHHTGGRVALPLPRPLEDVTISSW
jgi:predicted dehydrogenase